MIIVQKFAHEIIFIDFLMYHLLYFTYRVLEISSQIRQAHVNTQT